MTVVATCYLSYPYRSDPVRASLCRWHQITLFSPRRERENSGYCNTTNPTMNLHDSLTSVFAIPYRKVKTPIPIAQRPTKTAWHPPAVSSFKACKTPAR